MINIFHWEKIVVRMFKKSIENLVNQFPREMSWGLFIFSGQVLSPLLRILFVIFIEKCIWKGYILMLVGSSWTGAQLPVETSGDLAQGAAGMASNLWLHQDYNE